jgi:ankyrin repeat protein
MKPIAIFILLLCLVKPSLSQSPTDLLLDAIYYKDLELVEKFLNEDSTLANKPNELGVYPIIMAARYDQLNIVKALLNKGANPDKFLDDGATAIHYAVIKKNHEMVKLLISYGASVNFKIQPDEITPLRIAIQSGNMKMVAILVENGASLNSAAYGGASPLFTALSIGNIEIAEYLLSKGLDINKQDAAGDTMAMWAIKEGKPDFFNFLVAHHADFSIKNDLGMTALDIAKELNFKYYIKALTKLAASTPSVK